MMSWKPQALDAIARLGTSPWQRAAATAHLLVLAQACESFVKDAPAPQIEVADGELHVSWFWRRKQRALTLAFDHPGGVTLLLLQKQHAESTPCPTEERITSALRSMFEGYAGPEQALLPWRRLRDADGVIQCEKDLRWLFAIETQYGWEYFTDAVIGDAETGQAWRSGVHGWPLGGEIWFTEPPLPPAP